MQNKPYYEFAPLDIFEYYAPQNNDLLEAGISKSNLIVDPGIGFENLHPGYTLTDLVFSTVKVPIAIGVSRKSFIAGLSKCEISEDRLPGSLAMAVWAYNQAVKY